jgi:hypothetical protein
VSCGDITCLFRTSSSAIESWYRVLKARPKTNISNRSASTQTALGLVRDAQPVTFGTERGDTGIKISIASVIWVCGSRRPMRSVGTRTSG